MRPDRALLARFSPATLTIAGTFAIVMGFLLALAGNTNAFGAGGNGFTPCLPGSQPIQVRYTFDAGPAEPAAYGLNTYTLTGFDQGACDGSAVVLTISGNAAGDPAAPVTEVLGTYDTKLDPCTQQPAAQPVAIANGSIVVHTCATYGGVAGPANVHDATLLHLKVDGRDLPIGPVDPIGPVTPTTTSVAPTVTSTAPPSTAPAPTASTASPGPTSTDAAAPTTVSPTPVTAVLGETISRPPSSDGSGSSALATAARLPFTGSYAALTIWLGLLVSLGGVALFLLGRRRSAADGASSR